MSVCRVFIVYHMNYAKMFSHFIYLASSWHLLAELCANMFFFQEFFFWVTWSAEIVVYQFQKPQHAAW